MNKDKFYNLLTPLVDLYSDIEKDMILDILERIDNYNGKKGTLKWYLDKLTEFKVFEKHNVSIINKNKKEIKRILKDIIETSAKNSISIDTLETYNKHYDTNLSVQDIFNSASANNLISEALKNTDDITKLINTKAIEAANKEYRNILNTAYLETSTGIYTYDKSIKLAIDKMAENGILMANYDSGRRISIESAVRRDIVTRVNKLVGDVELTTAKDIMQTNLVYVDQHLGARTRTKYTKNDYEAHDEWQGKVYMINGSNEKYDNLYEKTGYGEMLGLKGINCYHDLRPYFEWETIPKPIDIEESRKERELLDTQREYERNIRTLKRQKIIDKKMGYEEDYRNVSKKLTKVNMEYDSWLNEHDKIRNKNREYISNKQTYKDNWFDSLTHQEQRDLKEYISSGSYKINEPLYNRKTLTEEQIRFRDSLDNALLNAPKYQGIVNRSIDIENKEQLNNILSIFANDDRTGSWGSFISSSKNVYDKNMKLQFIIKSKNGRDLSNLNNEGGGEILFERKTKFKYIDFKKENGKIYVKLEEIE